MHDADGHGHFGRLGLSPLHVCFLHMYTRCNQQSSAFPHDPAVIEACLPIKSVLISDGSVRFSYQLDSAKPRLCELLSLGAIPSLRHEACRCSRAGPRALGRDRLQCGESVSKGESTTRRCVRRPTIWEFRDRNSALTSQLGLVIGLQG